MIAVFYALCSITPALALALGGSPHCLTEDHRGAAKTLQAVHDHGDGQLHRHAGGSLGGEIGEAEDGGVPGNCCGLFCVTALPAAAYATVGGKIHAASVQPAAQDWLEGRGPDRINRPPIAPLSL